MELNQDFKEFIESLNKNDVEYLVIGGYAVNLHGYPRYTKDIDFWINASQVNLRKLLTAIEDFGFGSLKLTIEDFSNPDNIVQLGVAPNRIDLLTEVEGLDFRQCYEKKELVFSDELKISVLDIDGLIKAKKRTGRAQDLADAEKLDKIKSSEE